MSKNMDVCIAMHTHRHIHTHTHTPHTHFTLPSSICPEGLGAMLP